MDERSAKEIEKRIEFLLEPLLKANELVLVDIEVKGIGGRGMVRIYIDKEGGVTVRDCENLSRELSVLLDAEDFIPGPYILEVSSPGLERVIKKDRELRWAIGKEVQVFLRSGSVTGKLMNFDENLIKISSGDREQEIPRSEITKIKLIYRE